MAKRGNRSRKQSTKMMKYSQIAHLNFAMNFKGPIRNGDQ